MIMLRLLVVLLSMVAIGGCSKPRELLSRDGKTKLILPEGMFHTPGMSADGDITAADTENDLYVVVVNDPKTTLAYEPIFADYNDRNKKMFDADNLNQGPMETITVNGLNARRWKMHGVVRGIRVSYIVTTVESDTAFHRILTWTLESKFADRSTALQAIADSFEVVDSW